MLYSKELEQFVFGGSKKKNCDKAMCFSVMLRLLFFLLSCLCFNIAIVDASDVKIFHNHFAVHIANATSDVASSIAEKHGFRNLGQIGALEGYFLFEHERIRKRSTGRSDFHHEKLANEPGVSWVEQQYEKRRTKRDFASLNPTIRQVGPSNFALGKGSEFPDPAYAEQWYLHGGGLDGFDMNVIPAWRKGYSGKGVVVSILDDGIQTNHPDLAQNYDPLASADINDNDNDPMPRDNGDNKHGTRCAGEVAAVAFNSYCGVGIAFNASIGGVRMLDGTVNDAVEARALSLNPDHIDIYSASWGPEDDGKTVDGPGPLAKRAFINGIMKGRKGKGSIFIWASGNGGRHEDSCNCDGYTNSIFTLSISSATQAGFKPWYLEECSSTLATTYSSGRPDVDRSIATVDMDGSLRPDFLCTSDHTGTSASAPLAAGICALALEANPNLTWRDMQHLVVFTSRPDPLHDSGWVTNGIGKKVSHKFGYGLMDAAAMVTTAEQWTNVPPQHVCQTPADTSERLILNGFGQKLEVLVDTDACAGTPHEIRYLEHVQCRISLRFAPRGNLRIRLTSPSGTPTVLLFERPRDVLDSSFEDWPFMSVHFWGERAAGRWKLEIINAGNKRASKAGILKKWQLVFYGTDTNPVRLSAPRFVNVALKPPTFTGVATTGRDIHSRPFQPPPVTPSRFSSRVPFSQVFFPGSTSGFHPSFGTISPNFQSAAGSDPVTYRTALVVTTPSTPMDGRIACSKFSLDGSCVETCPTIGYYATTDQRCEKCHPTCSSCIGPGPDHCIRCAAKHYNMIDKNLCVEECPEFYHLDETKKLCISCLPQCRECNSSLSCTACEFRFVLHDGHCLASCLPGSYETDDYGCASCHVACGTCRGPNADHCVTCADDMVEHEGKCVDQCPVQYWKEVTLKQCLPCPPGCETCHLQDSGYGLFCTECSSNWLLDTSTRQCLNPSTNTCPEDEYAVDGKCYPCHGTCAQCSGASSHNCTHCRNNTSMYQGSCTVECPQGTFAEGGSQGSEMISYCRPCPLSCALCDGLDHCTECLGGLHLQDGRCLAACYDGYYSDRGVCVRCHGSCAVCSGPLATDCLRCTSGFSWLQQRCLSSCPAGYYNASMDSVLTHVPATAILESNIVVHSLCVKCEVGCRTCDGEPSNCISCADGFAFNNKSCVPISSLIEVPLVEFVKESESRGARAGKDISQQSSPNGIYYWTVGLCASLIVGLMFVFIALQVRSSSDKRYTLVPLGRGNETGVDNFLLAPTDLDDEDGETVLYKV